MRTALLGAGTIARLILERAAGGDLPGVEIVGVAGRRPDSPGAALAASLQLAERIREGVIVMIFPDSGTRYLTERFWEAEAR